MKDSCGPLFVVGFSIGALLPASLTPLHMSVVGNAPMNAWWHTQPETAMNASLDTRGGPSAPEHERKKGYRFRPHHSIQTSNIRRDSRVSKDFLLPRLKNKTNIPRATFEEAGLHRHELSAYALAS